MAILEQRRDSIRMEPRRAAVFDAARAAVDRIVMLKLADGRITEAFDYMDRARASLAPVGFGSVPDDHPPRAPPGEVAVQYALIADTLLVWTIVGHSVEVFRTVIDTVRLVRTLEGLEAKLEARGSEGEVRPALSDLYEWLVRPVEARLGGDETPLVIVADGYIAAVPFAALHDVRRSTYLIEKHPVRFVMSLREAQRRVVDPSEGGVLFVADPAFDQIQHPLLERLRNAREEVRSAAAAYPNAAVLYGSDATRPAMEVALGRAEVIHFAGHAVFDDARPERSYLVLAPAPGQEDSADFTAAEMARLNLQQVRLVVLSACRTVRTGRSRASGFTGLSGALLAAGAGGAVGSTWDVDDRLTSVLMREFHRAYRDSRDGTRALRPAQMRLLQSNNESLRSPTAWAGFRYAGR